MRLKEEGGVLEGRVPLPNRRDMKLSLGLSAVGGGGVF